MTRPHYRMGNFIKNLPNSTMKQLSCHKITKVKFCDIFYLTTAFYCNNTKYNPSCSVIIFLCAFVKFSAQHFLAYIYTFLHTDPILLTKIPFVQMPFSRVCTDAGENWVQEIESVSFVKQKKQNTIFIPNSNFLLKIYCSMLFFLCVIKWCQLNYLAFIFPKTKWKPGEISTFSHKK